MFCWEQKETSPAFGQRYALEVGGIYQAEVDEVAPNTWRATIWAGGHVRCGRSNPVFSEASFTSAERAFAKVELTILAWLTEMRSILDDQGRPAAAKRIVVTVRDKELAAKPKDPV